MYMCVFMCVCVAFIHPWPLHGIAITNIVWCMAYKSGVGGVSYIAQQTRNSMEIVRAMQVSRKNEKTIDSCTHD